MPAEFETLQYIGSLGLNCEIEFEVIKQNLGAGYSNRLTTGSSSGNPGWRLVYKVLPQTMDSPVMFGAEAQSRADYVWDFYCRHMARASRSFIIVDPRSGNRFLAGFVDNKLSYEMFAIKLFSSGLGIEYRREPGVATLDDGSLGDIENPDEI